METAPALIFIFSSWPLNPEQWAAAVAAVAVAAEAGEEQWLCQIYSGRLQITLSCRWMTDKHGELRFLAQTEAPHDFTGVHGSSECRTLAPPPPPEPRTLLGFWVLVVRTIALISAQPTLSSRGFGRAIHQTERRLGVQGGLLNWYRAACCPFIKGEIIIHE